MSLFVEDQLSKIVPNSVVSFILTTGEEIITTVSSIQADYLMLSKPRKLLVSMEIDHATGEQHMKMGLTHFFTTDQDEVFKVPLRFSMIGSVVVPAEGAINGYQKQTTSLALVK